MIYLIDDKIIRQESFGWDSATLNKYKDILICVHNIKELDNLKNEILNGDNVILFHDSFFDNPINKQEKQTDLIKQQLNDYSVKKKKLVVFFSGSIGNRTIHDLTLYCPVKVVYENLDMFLSQYKNNSTEILPEHIAYGKNYKYEQLLILKNQIWESFYLQSNNSAIVPNDKLLDELESLSKILNFKFTTEDKTVEQLKYQIQTLLADIIYE